MKNLCLTGLIIVSVCFCLWAEEIEITNAQVLDMCKRATGLMDTYTTVPLTIAVDISQDTEPKKLTAAEFYYAMVLWLGHYQVHHEAPASIKVALGIQGPTKPVKTEVASNVYPEEILTVSERSTEFIDGYQRVPNFIRVSYGNKVSPELWLYAMSKAITSYAENSSFPERISGEPVEAPNSWTGEVSCPLSTPSTYSWSQTLDVYYEHQPDSYTCGPTSLKMLLAYYGKWYSVSTISSYMASIGDSPYYDGVAESTIITSGKHYGFGSTYRDTGWTAIKNAIAGGKPVVAHLYIKANSYPIIYGGGPAYVQYTGGHYVSVVGLQSDANGKVLYVVCHDPAKYGYIKYTGLSFQTSWGEMNYAIITLK